jgi:hypothetical protein
MKLTIEDTELAGQVRDYLRANGTEITDSTPIAITLPGGANKQPQLCMSGSGKMTQGGKFFPGYDAKLKSALHAIARGKPEKIPVELLERGPMYRPVDEWTPEMALEALDQFGWPHPVIKPPKAKKEPAEGDQSTDSDGETGQTKASRRRMTQAAKAEKEQREAEAAEAAAGEASDEDLENAEV